MTDNDHDVDIYCFPDGKVTEPITPDEAAKLGFCPGCGYFVAGSEADDVSMGQFGLCTECVEELKIETGEYHIDFPEPPDLTAFNALVESISDDVFNAYRIPPSVYPVEDNDNNADKLPF